MTAVTQIVPYSFYAPFLMLPNTKHCATYCLFQYVAHLLFLNPMLSYSTLVPQLVQNAAPVANGFPHFLQIASAAGAAAGVGAAGAGVGAIAAAGAATGAPQLVQNAVPGFNGCPHLVQRLAAAAAACCSAQARACAACAACRSASA